MTILRMPDVRRKTGLSKSRIYRLEREGRFPARVELGPNSVGWYENEVDEWNSARRRRGIFAPQNLAQASAPQG